MSNITRPVRVVRLVVPVALAMALAGLINYSAAAEEGNAYSDAFIDGMLLKWAEECTQQGGQAQVHMDFSTNGHLNNAYVRCLGASPQYGGSWYCGIDYTYNHNCFLTRPEETVPQSVTVKPGTVVVLDHDIDSGAPAGPPVLGTSGSNQPPITRNSAPQPATPAEDGRGS